MKTLSQHAALYPRPGRSGACDELVLSSKVCCGRLPARCETDMCAFCVAKTLVPEPQLASPTPASPVPKARHRQGQEGVCGFIKTNLYDPLGEKVTQGPGLVVGDSWPHLLRVRETHHDV